MEGSILNRIGKYYCENRITMLILFLCGGCVSVVVGRVKWGVVVVRLTIACGSFIDRG